MQKARQRDAQDPDIALRDSWVPLLALAELSDTSACFQPENLLRASVLTGKQQPLNNLF